MDLEMVYEVIICSLTLRVALRFLRFSSVGTVPGRR
jgi:hypothetical protein